MIKIFVTGDNHIGKKYDRYPDIKDTLIKSRFDCLDNTVKTAENEGCDLFVVTGDLFDNISSIKQKDVKAVVDILSGFAGSVLVLPGNHDYYTGEEKVWKDFVKCLSDTDNNITLLTEMREYEIEAGEETAVIYPALCQSKHSSENNLGWIKNTDIPKDGYHIGIAHGAIEGLTPDMKNEYFLMTERELNDIPVDVWLIGHTHIPYPALSTEKDISGFKIFNAGTHEQTDLSNNTKGYSFIITLDNTGGVKTVYARSVVSGHVRYYDLELSVEYGKTLEETISAAVRDIGDFSVLRLNISGLISSDEYNERQSIYSGLLDRFLTYEIFDNDLSELITTDKIREEFAEIGFASQLLEKLLDDPKETQMAYELLKSCQEGTR